MGSPTNASLAPKVPAADQTLQILRLLATARGPLPASMIAHRLELPRSTVYHLLTTLQEHGFVMHLKEERRYGLGTAVVELNSAYARQEPLTRLGIPLLSALTDELDMSTHLALLHGTDVLYVVEQRAPGSPSLVTEVDVRLPAHLTASGRAILAVMPRAQVRALFPNTQSFVHRPGRPTLINSYSKLRSVLNETALQGFSTEREEITEGISSVGVAVLDHRGWPVASIATTFRDDEVPEARWAEIAVSVRDTANLLTTRLHGRVQS